MASFIRTLDRLSRFILASVALGLTGGVKAIVIDRMLSNTSATLSIRIPATKKRFFFRCRGDRGAISHLYSNNYRVVSSEPNEIKTIIDAGANIGVESIRFAHFHPQARIISLEAQRDNFDLLKANTGGFPMIHPINRALYSTSTMLGVSRGNCGKVNENEAFFVTDKADPAGERVQGITVEEILDQFQLDSIDIFKLDIEGAEFEVFSEPCEKWISRVRCLIFECPDSDRPYTTQLIFKRLASTNRGYRTYICGENLVLFREDVGWRLEVEDRFR